MLAGAYAIPRWDYDEQDPEVDRTHNPPLIARFPMVYFSDLRLCHAYAEARENRVKRNRHLLVLRIVSDRGDGWATDILLATDAKLRTLLCEKKARKFLRRLSLDRISLLNVVDGYQYTLRNAKETKIGVKLLAL